MQSANTAHTPTTKNTALHICCTSHLCCPVSIPHPHQPGHQLRLHEEAVGRQGSGCAHHLLSQNRQRAVRRLFPRLSVRETVGGRLCGSSSEGTAAAHFQTSSQGSHSSSPYSSSQGRQAAPSSSQRTRAGPLLSPSPPPIPRAAFHPFFPLTCRHRPVRRRTARSIAHFAASLTSSQRKKKRALTERWRAPRGNGRR